MDFLDPYEMRARIAPAIIVSLPVAISIIIIATVISDKLPPLILSGGFFLVALIYALSLLIRSFGRKIENKLWINWDGAPSTRLMRWRDSTFGYDLKQQLHNAVQKRCGIKLCSEEEERKNPHRADEQITQAFFLVKAIVRQDDPEGIWTKHNAEYGFHRNLLGGRSIWLVFSIIGTMALGVAWYFKKDDIFIFGLSLDILIAMISILSSWYFLPKITKNSADRYAESVWNSFLACSKSGFD